MKLSHFTLLLPFLFSHFACGTGSDTESNLSQVKRVTDLNQFRPVRIPGGVADGITVNPALMDAMRNTNILQYAQSRMGQRIDRGECWDLVNQALIYANAKLPYGFDYYEFGREISQHQLVPGNLISFRDVQINYPNSWQSFPKHVAIVKEVFGTKVTVIHQNAPIGSAVRQEVIDLAYVRAGSVRYFQADKL